jgi:hypothetical protein
MFHQKEEMPYKIDNEKLLAAVISSTFVLGKVQIFKVQLECHGSSGVFFYADGRVSRFGCEYPGLGSMYASSCPATAMAEYLKITLVSESDLLRYSMASINCLGGSKIVDMRKLFPQLGLTLHDITDSNYGLTQYIVSRLQLLPVADRPNGILYPSDKGPCDCYVFWGAVGNNHPLFTTSKVETLSSFQHNGEDIDCLLERVGISVVGD